MALQKNYVYKVSRSGVYLGTLSNVKSKFAYSQAIYTTGAQLTIEVAQSADSSHSIPGPLLDETGAIITDETGASILEERPIEIVGDSADNILIRNDNTIDVYEFSNYWPNGKLVFSGYISKWKAVFGGNNDIVITVLSKGQDLAQYLTPGSVADTVDQSHAFQDDSLGPINEPGAGRTNPSRLGQTFTVGAGVTNISGIDVMLYMGQSASMTLSIYSLPTDQDNGIAALASVTQVLPATAVNTVFKFTLSSLLTVTPGRQYFFIVSGPPYPGDLTLAPYIYFKDTGSYSGGDMWIKGIGALITNTSPSDLYFKTYTSANTTSKTYTSSDPSTTLAALMDYYISAGGTVAKPVAGYLATGVTPAQTTFKINTILEAIQTIADLGPADWYWYVDPATNTLYYKQTATTATHRMILGRHIESLELEATKESIINVVYFSGGPTAGINLFVNVNSASSLVANRRGMARISNNRVTDTSTGQLIAQNYIAQHNSQNYTTSITINDAAYDISLFNLGETVGFAGFGTFVDTLILQIVGITRGQDNITLSLGIQPPRATDLNTQTQRELADLQTIDNPTTPS